MIHNNLLRFHFSGKIMCSFTCEPFQAQACTRDTSFLKPVFPSCCGLGMRPPHTLCSYVPFIPKKYRDETLYAYSVFTASSSYNFFHIQILNTFQLSLQLSLQGHTNKWFFAPTSTYAWCLAACRWSIDRPMTYRTVMVYTRLQIRKQRNKELF